MCGVGDRVWDAVDEGTGHVNESITQIQLIESQARGDEESTIRCCDWISDVRDCVPVKVE